ncbi:MAG: sugar phosphate isomerase/epimerase [Armatimonadetes bacterium]|nr:sugar phosphate isomerase/epimerase [Armatimonadota bacterium]
MIRFGVCVPYNLVTSALRLGADYAEVPGHSAAEFVAQQQDQLPSSIEATNLFFPEGYNLFSDPEGKIVAHAKTAIAAASKLGVKVMVLGSGGARRAPAEMDPDEALEKFVLWAYQLDDLAAQFKMRVAPESLSPEETNVGTELRPLAHLLLHKGLAFTADSRHILRELTTISKAIPATPIHVHLAMPDGSPPRAHSLELQSFAARLLDLGYSGRVSLECRWTDFESELPAALSAARNLFRGAA